ncbi:MAG: hypothetical protein AAF772_10440 [Acidobacteriota bacterium]
MAKRSFEDTDIALERALRESPDAHAASAPSTRPLRAVVSGVALDADVGTLDDLLTTLRAEISDIDRVLMALREHEAAEVGAPVERPVAVVSSETLGDPQALSQMLAPHFSQRLRFEQLFEQAKDALERLDAYQLSTRAPDGVVDEMRAEDDLRRLEFVVEFLRSLQGAAASFEALHLPVPHIRDYLTHLYRMRDWREMSRLVLQLELCARAHVSASNAPDPPSPTDQDANDADMETFADVVTESETDAVS